MIQDSAKTILCYGDSNTWGQIPRSQNRFDRSIRWPSVLQNKLGEDFEIISEGLRGRTFASSDSLLNGLNHLSMILSTHKPIYIVMLGTNDLKSDYSLHPKDIAINLEKTIKIIKEKEIQHIIIICPAPIIKPELEAKSDEGKKLDEMMARGIELSTHLSSLYKEIAEKYNCNFINAGDYISSSKKDGYHLDEEAHGKLAEVVEEEILEIYKN